MIIRTPSPALRARIVAAGEMGRLLVTSLPDGGAEVSRPSGVSDDGALSEPEQRRVAGLVAADDAEPFAAVPPHEFGIWTPGGGALRGYVVASSRNEAVDMLAREWFSGVAEHAERAVTRKPSPNHRAWTRGIYDQGGRRARGAGSA